LACVTVGLTHTEANDLQANDLHGQVGRDSRGQSRRLTRTTSWRARQDSKPATGCLEDPANVCGIVLDVGFN
jgi:hypothetical protein